MPAITTIIQDAEVKAALKKLADKMQNLESAMELIGVYYERSVRDNFDKQADPSGKPWQPLANATLHLGIFGAKGFRKGRGKNNKGKGYLNKSGKSFLMGKRILRDSGDLIESIHHQADKNSVIIGAGGQIKYPAIHQFGGPAGRGRKVKIPARPYLAMNQGTDMELAEKDKRMILELIAEELSKN